MLNEAVGRGPLALSGSDTPQHAVSGTEPVLRLPTNYQLTRLRGQRDFTKQLTARHSITNQLAGARKRQPTD